jgi:ABC-2 type transport system permease protein
MLQDAIHLCLADLRHLLRSRETILWVFVMPFVFFYFIGTITGGQSIGGSGSSAPTPIAIVLPTGQDGVEYPQIDGGAETTIADTGGFVIHELARRLEAENFAVRYRSGIEAASQSGRQLKLPALTANVKTSSDALLEGQAIKPSYRHTRDGMGASLDEIRLQKAIWGLIADLAVFTIEDTTPSPAGFATLAQMDRSLKLDVKTAGKRQDPPVGFAQTVPGTMIMFTMMILLTSGSILLVTERRAGLLRRLASAPISRSSIILGKWASRVALGLVQITFAMIVGMFVFGVDWGSALPMVSVVLLAWACFNASLGLLLANLVANENQMSALAVISSLVLAALGGCWWPIEITPGWMQDLAGFLPTGWAMSSMHQLVHFGNGAEAVLPQLGLLITGTILMGAAAAKRFRFE